MKKISFVALATIIVSFMSCGGGNDNSQDSNSVTLSVEETSMGDFSDYGSFGKDVTIKPNNEEKSDGDKKEYIASILLKITNSIAWKYNLDFEIKVADKDHVEIADLGYLYIDGESDNDNDDFDEFLYSGNHRQEFDFILTDEEWQKIKSEGKYLIIKCNQDSEDRRPYKKDVKKSSASDNDDISTSSSSAKSFASNDTDSDEDEDEDNEETSHSKTSSKSGSQDWDSILDSYDSYVTKYVALAKKAANGDMDALQEYSSLMQQAQELSDKLSNAQTEMSPSQWARYMKITSKMAKAANHL